MSNFLLLTFFGIVAIGNHPSDGGQIVSEFQPEFAEPLENLTIPVGRDATFTCRVRGLGGYRVGWVRADSKAIQAIHTHVITHNPRITVSHTDHTMWHLHIKQVKEEDRGPYMCQVNTDPMISQVAHLEVVVPPDFIPEHTSGDLMAPEGSTVKLQCEAKGHPEPSIIWRREGGQNITLKTNAGSKTQVSVYEGNVLRLVKISRADMGPYLCIASNGVPPSISKRITVSVHFHPVIHVPNQLVGAPLGTDVTLECNVEAYPRSIHFWMKDNGAMIISGDRYEVQEIVKSMFEVKMILVIRKFRKSDAGTYHCVAKNSLGDVDSVVKLHVLKMQETMTEGPSSKGNEVSALSYDGDDEDDDEEEDDYYDLNRKDSSSSRSNSNNNYAPDSSLSNSNNNRILPKKKVNISSNSNNNINSGGGSSTRRGSTKSYSLGGNSNSNNNNLAKNSGNGNIPFKKTVVVNPLNNKGGHNSCIQMQISNFGVITITVAAAKLLLQNLLSE